MKERIATDSMTHEFQLLRNRIEAEIHGPALVLVTSATERDGASLTAYGLADSLSQAGHRVVLVTTGDSTFAGRSDRDGRFSIVAISPQQLATISHSGVSELVRELRQGDHYVVVDAGDLPANSFGLLLTASADATLIAFRTGRTQKPADRVMLDTLERAEAKVLGIVMTDAAAIERFTGSGEPELQEPQSESAALAMVAKRFEAARSRLARFT
jgi:Mrp family chromosome partitioning ATPase